MTLSTTPPGTHRLFMFSFYEHEWDVHDSHEAHEELLRRAREGTWDECPMPNDLDDHDEADTLDSLRAIVLSTMFAEPGLPAQAAELPFAALQQMITDEGWTFVSGSLLAFEGHHNDSEIYAVLARL